MTENRSGKALRDNPKPSKHQANVLSETLEPEENSRISKIPGMRLRPPRCTGQMTPWNSADDGAVATSGSHLK